MGVPAESEKNGPREAKTESDESDNSSFSETKNEPEKSYGQVLKSSSVIGGSEGISYLIRMVRTKLVAILIGPSGVGLVGLYMSATQLIEILSGLGIGRSGVREIAEANGSGNKEQLARTASTLKRACWATGILGWALTAGLSYPLSLWIFDSSERALAISFLGVSVLLTAIAAGQRALLQGTRRITDIALLNILGGVAGTAVAVGLYAWLGESGIVPVLITTAAVNLGFTWWFARRVEISQVPQSFSDTWHNSKRLVGLGLAFMWAGLLSAGVALAIRGLILQEFGLDAGGIYQAAWAISGLFAGFVLTAMGTDFYPRLTSVAKDHDEVNRLVNEQTEIAILLSLPGLIGSLAFAPWLMHIFYTEKFVAGAELLPWFVLGVFGRVVSFPMGYILLAVGASRAYALSETLANIVYLVLTLIGLSVMGLLGTAAAFCGLYIWVTGYVYIVVVRITGFQWSPMVLRLLIASGALVALGFCVQAWVPGYTSFIVGGLLTVFSCMFSIRGLASRLGEGHALIRLACRLPGGRQICGI